MKIQLIKKMVTATDTDTNIPSVMKEGKLYNLVTRNRYHVYGLKQLRNPLVQIEYEDAYVNDNFKNQLKSLMEFFKLNNIECEVDNKSGQAKIAIGLRVDLRKFLNARGKPLFASTILSTIIYCLEDRIDIETMKQYKLPSVPTFPPKTT